MHRSAMEELIKWKNSLDRKPLIIKGARQVGKTWIMKEFGETCYNKYAYINFDNNERMENLFNGNLDIKRIITALQIESDVSIEADNTLIIFDEVQKVPRALSSLKYFRENAQQYHVVAAVSSLGVTLQHSISYPMDKVDFMDLYPLNFLEFLDASGNGNLADLLKSCDFDLISNFKEKYIDLLKQYYYIGGMPEVVASFVDSLDYRACREIQEKILTAYEQDFSKYAPHESVPRIRMLWNSIPSQLAKDNRKFKYGLVRRGARAREYDLAMTWLIDCGLIHKVRRITKPDIPLKEYQDQNAFKLFILDVGLLTAMSKFDLKSILEGNRIFEDFKGALTEQYVLQQLKSSCEITPYYWSAEKSTGEIDFIFQMGDSVVPLEVKAKENLQAKSLKNYCLKYSPKYAVRTSMSDYRQEENLVNVPLYAITVLL